MPWALGETTPVKVSGSPSGSLSFARKREAGTVTVTFWRVPRVSAAATGGWFAAHVWQANDTVFSVIVSMRQIPLPGVPWSSQPMRKRSRMLCPAAALGRSTVVVT